MSSLRPITLKYDEIFFQTNTRILCLEQSEIPEANNRNLFMAIPPVVGAEKFITMNSTISAEKRQSTSIITQLFWYEK